MKSKSRSKKAKYKCDMCGHTSDKQSGHCGSSMQKC